MLLENERSWGLSHELHIGATRLLQTWEVFGSGRFRRAITFSAVTVSYKGYTVYMRSVVTTVNGDKSV